MGPWGTGEKKKRDREKNKHKYNYKILARSLILSVMNFMRLFIKIETSGIRSPTAFFPPKALPFPLLCDQVPYSLHPGCKVLLPQTAFGSRTKIRINQVLHFLLLPHHTLFTTYHMLQCINRSRQMCSHLCKNHISIINFLFIPLCPSYLDYSPQPQQPLSYLGLITHCFLSIYGNKSKWEANRGRLWGSPSPFSVCPKRDFPPTPSLYMHFFSLFPFERNRKSTIQQKSNNHV